MLKFFLSVTLCVLFCVGTASSLVNEEVSRLIDLRGHNVEVSLNVTLSEPNLAGGISNTYRKPLGKASCVCFCK